MTGISLAAPLLCRKMQRIAAEAADSEVKAKVPFAKRVWQAKLRF